MSKPEYTPDELVSLIKRELDVFRIAHSESWEGTDTEYVVCVWDSVQNILDLFPQPTTREDGDE